MYCYRRHGHNEQDEPRFTQPLLYELIDGREPLRENYARNLIWLGDLSEERAEAIATESLQRLERELSGGPDAGVVEKIGSLGVWSRYHGGPEPIDETTTGVERERLVQFLQAMTELPSGFETHPRVQRQLDARRSMAEGGRGVDWGAAEALAIASLLAEGYPVRISGQDSQRGTFAHRHAVIHEMRTGATHVPLSQFATGDACLQVLNSPLSEIAVLGFDFGYSLNRPDALVVWEAQFGDFANMAQVIIDQFITSSEEKWNRLSGITLLLPHGLEGQGPEHSHARPERFLQLAVNDNIQVAAPSTAAQFFHCLRRQVLRPWRKPLIVLTPKSQLQQPCVRSPLDDLSDGYFNCVLGDKQGNSEQASRLLLCSGGIYHELCAERMKRGRHDVHIARLEQLYPLRRELLNDLVAGYAPSVPLIWVQEEPENMGPLPHLRNALFRVAGERVFEIVARKPSASPATGSMATHKVEQESLSDKAFA